MTQAESYFVRLTETSFMPTIHVSGAWNEAEQHIAPPMGLLAHLVEKDHAARGGSLLLSRLSYDILGVLPLEAVEVEMRVIRPGRSIELVEATMSHNGRPALVLRAWLLGESDTKRVAGTSNDPIPARSEMPVWPTQNTWPGGFIQSIEGYKLQHEAGRAQSWVRTKYPLLEGEATSPTAHMMGIIDVANGTTPRAHPSEAIFPNLDLTVSLLRAPVDEWLGLDTSVTFGDNGFGLTHTFMHDGAGFLGVATQSLTVRLMK